MKTQMPFLESIHGFKPRTLTEVLIHLMEKRRILDLVTECWIDTGTMANLKGYRKIYYNRQWIPTTHFIWEITNCSPVPVGMMMCHRCDNPSCFNPAHLFLGTNTDNQRDMIAKGRARHPNGECLPHKVNADQVILIRNEYAEGAISFRLLGQKYGISKTQVRQIVRRMKWKHLK